MVNKYSKGFTLLELVITMAIIGILAGLVLVAVNPFEQIARARDASRISTITELGKSLESYHADHNGSDPPTGGTWISTLVDANEARVIPDNPDYLSGVSCSTLGLDQGGYCYNTGSGDTIIYARLESHMDHNTCGNNIPFWVYSVARGQGGGVCVISGQDPSVASSTSFSF